jgi:hypothetical protein
METDNFEETCLSIKQVNLEAEEINLRYKSTKKKT